MGCPTLTAPPGGSPRVEAEKARLNSGFEPAGEPSVVARLLERMGATARSEQRARARTAEIAERATGQLHGGVADVVMQDLHFARVESSRSSHVTHLGR